MRAPRTPNALGMASLAALFLGSCSGSEPTAEKTTTAPTVAAGETAVKNDKSAFELLPAQYSWSGSGKRDDMFQPHFSLSVPETDDIVWASQCLPGGKVKTNLYFAPPEGFASDRIAITFETDRSLKPLQYSAAYVADGQFDGFALEQRSDDPMFDEMRAGRWVYVQIGEGSKAGKTRISLERAGSALAAFLPACSAKAKPAAKAAATRAGATQSAAVRYACDDGRTAMATYMGNDTDTPIVRLDVGGSVYLLPQDVSGSGARYASTEALNDGQWRSWHTKATNALLTESDNSDLDGSGAKMVNCREQAAR